MSTSRIHIPIARNPLKEGLRQEIVNLTTELKAGQEALVVARNIITQLNRQLGETEALCKTLAIHSDRRIRTLESQNQALFARYSQAIQERDLVLAELALRARILR